MENYHVVWADDFNGENGVLPNTSNWEYQISTPDTNSNQEVQYYQKSTKNAFLSGAGTAWIAPVHESDGRWTSARLRSWKNWKSEPGKKMVIQAEIRFGQSPTEKQKGIWPAFWTLGQACRSPGNWPACGEFDIMELADGRSTTVANVHYGRNGRISKGSSPFPFDRTQYHTYAVKIDREPAAWQEQKIQFYLDGTMYHQVTGAQVGNLEDWTILAHTPIYITLNVAVGGGGYAGPTDGNTGSGPGVGYELRYVAVYGRN
ncbi:concanavalin A-like lectin/glucanase [Bisporella sp. PMI_857]|nr:concanavalin A-like lectin/glucanase [Bisporella sp. PMI_857]